MEYYLKPSAVRDLRKLSKSLQRRIFSKLDFYTNLNNPFDFAEALKDKTFGDFRFRIGDYRVIFDFDAKREIIVILAVGHRKDIYR